MADIPADRTPVQHWLATATTLAHLGQYPAATMWAERALAATQQAGDDADAADYLAALHGLGRIHEACARYAAARLLYERALVWSDAVYGRKHPTTGLSFALLGWLLAVMGQHAAGDALRAQAAATFKAGQKRHPIATALALVEVPLPLAIDDNYSRLLPLYTRAAADLEADGGPDDPRLIGLLAALAWQTMLAHGSSAAVPYLDRALALATQQPGPPHPQHVALLLDRGRVHAQELEGQAARACVTQALRLAQASLPAMHVTIATCVARLAGRSGRHDRETARRHHEAAAAIAEQALGAEHPTVGSFLYSLAGHLHSQWDARWALPVYERVLAIWDAAYGPEHSLVIGVRQTIRQLRS